VRAPAVVLGGGVTALAVVRALRHHGIQTYVLAPDDDIACHSRGVLRAQLAACDDRVASLATISMPDHGVLIACDDAWQRAVAQFIEAGGDGRFTSFTPPVATVERLLDKGLFASTLDELAIPRPRTWDARTAEDLADIDKGELAAFFLKPRDSKHFHDEFGVKALRFDDRREAERLLAQAVARGHKMVVQEYIECTPGEHVFLDGFVDRQGRFTALLARRRLRMYPPRFGNSTDSVTIPLGEAADAVASLQLLFDHIGYRGLFDAEFVFDRRTAEHKIVEVNARPWWQLQLSTAAGLDVVHMAYLDALCEVVPPCEHYMVGRRWVHTLPDLHSRWDSATGRSRGERSPRPRPSTVESWWRATHAVLQPTDPVPGLVQLRRVARDGLRHLLAPLRRAGSGNDKQLQKSHRA
jgi:predicted ATP-grasp superfamily ATP-dependent carboligase